MSSESVSLFVPAWWYMPVIHAFGKKRQKDRFKVIIDCMRPKFEVSMGYIRPYLKNNKSQKQISADVTSSLLELCLPFLFPMEECVSLSSKGVTFFIFYNF